MRLTVGDTIRLQRVSGLDDVMKTPGHPSQPEGYGISVVERGELCPERGDWHHDDLHGKWIKDRPMRMCCRGRITAGDKVRSLRLVEEAHFRTFMHPANYRRRD